MSIWDWMGNPKSQNICDEIPLNGNNQGLNQQTTTTTGTQIDPTSQLGQLFGSGLISPQQFNQMLSSLSPLSAEEHAELEQLKADHNSAIKVAKLNAFKKLHAEMRQFVINAISWADDLKGIENAGSNTVKSERLLQLEEKLERNKLFQGGNGYLTPRPNMGNSGLFDLNMFQSIFKTISLPEGITSEELKQAHMEATMEEEMLDGKE